MGDVTDIKDRRKGRGGSRRQLQEKPRTSLPPLMDGKNVPAEREPTGRVAGAKRRSEILSLAVAGADAARIAEVLTERYGKKGWKGIKKATVQGIINQALTEMQEADTATIEKVRALQLARLDHMLQTWMVKFDKPDLAENTRLRIGDRILRLERLRAKIAGTEAPRKVELSGSIALGVDEKELERDERAWLDAGGNVIDLPDSAIQEVEPGDDS